MTREFFIKTVDRFVGTFNLNLPERTYNAWYEGLKNDSDKEFADAIDTLCRDLPEYRTSTNFVNLVKDQICEEGRYKTI